MNAGYELLGQRNKFLGRPYPLGNKGSGSNPFFVLVTMNICITENFYLYLHLYLYIYLYLTLKDTWDMHRNGTALPGIHLRILNKEGKDEVGWD